MGEDIESLPRWGGSPETPPESLEQKVRKQRFPGLGGFFICPEVRGQSITQAGI
jgi:hypothetical protein